MSNRRGSIALEAGEILAHHAMGDGQHVIRIGLPRLAARAVPGQFAHIRCDERLAMRRPMSVMRVDPAVGWAEFLYKDVGLGTSLLATKPTGTRLSVLGPIGTGFQPHADSRRGLLIGGGVGIPPMIFLADRFRQPDMPQPLVLMGSEIEFPFVLSSAKSGVAGICDEVRACVGLLEEWGVDSRLASLRQLAGCFTGYVTDLARAWLSALDRDVLARVGIYACGPTAMLKATSELAETFDLPCQICLEEYMACAVGGCAGCAVQVMTEQGPAMKRVCVDGPVFDSRSVVWS